MLQRSPGCSVWVIVGMVFGTSVAAAGEGGKEPLAALEVERGLVLPKGWVEVGARVDRKVSTGEWGPDGERVEWPAGTRWTYTTEAVALRAGVFPRVELHAEVPVHQARLVAESGTTTATGLGDATVGGRVEWVRHRPPTRSVATDLQIELPTGTIPPGAAVGAGPTEGALAFGSGQADLAFAVIVRQQLGPAALTADAAYTHRFVSAPAYSLASEPPGARVRPGDEVAGGLTALLQTGPLALSTRARARVWRPTSVASPGEAGGSEVPLTVLPDTEGWALEVAPGALLDVSRGVQLGAEVGLSAMGAGAALFPLEGLTPTRGTTLSAWLTVRG